MNGKHLRKDFDVYGVIRLLGRHTLINKAVRCCSRYGPEFILADQREVARSRAVESVLFSRIPIHICVAMATMHSSQEERYKDLRKDFDVYGVIRFLGRHILIKKAVRCCSRYVLQFILVSRER
ncbi:hypothetical protein CEXT_132321 [Caerostris extrusa]|uniref:Uncharacterized protein n=1 Tax=Caerostris extrusa TaxID=172846 RepID=A0AAV4R044_CAEEX|nr:hypothetical protein CEXT_132321 [Caerostris extrusa]